MTTTTSNLEDNKLSSTIRNKLSIGELYELKYQTISEETKLTEKMNATIKNGGLSKSSKLAIQNVKEAIAVSKKPFYTEAIVPINTARPANEESPTKKIYKTRNVDIVTLKQWFDTYGKPRAACKPFDFYVVPEDVKRTKEEIEALAQSMRRSHNEYEHINERVELMTKMTPIVQKPPKVKSLDHWFETYGKPNGSPSHKRVGTLSPLRK